MGNSAKIILKLFGILVIIGSIFIYMLSVATFGQYDSLTGLAVFLLFLGIILFIIGKKLPKSKQICSSCGFMAETKRELYNHTLTCTITQHTPEPEPTFGSVLRPEPEPEPYEQYRPEPTTKSETDNRSKYFQCKYCEMVFEKEVEQLNHYLVCEIKKKIGSHKEIDKKSKDTFKPSAKFTTDNDMTAEELEKKIRDDFSNY